MMRLRLAADFARRHWATLLFYVLAAAILAWVSWEAIWVRMITFEGGADYWEHSATLHALIENPWHPQHPHLVSNAGSPRFGPQYVLVALLARALHWDALRAMSASAILNTLLFLTGIRVFFAVYFRHPLAPLYGLLVMFGGWWLGFHYSNVYALPVYFMVSAFPSTTALGLTLLGFALVVRILRGPVQKRTRLLLLVLLGLWAAAIFIIHPLTAVMSLSGAGLLAVVEPHVPWRRRFEVVGAVALGCALSHFWPYFSPWLVIRGGRGEARGWAGETVKQAAELHVKRHLHEFYVPQALLKALGLATLTLLALPYFFLKRERWFVALGALSMLLPFAANAFVELPLGHRFVLLAMVYLHIGLVSLLLALTPSYPHAFGFVRRRAGAIAASVLSCAVLLVFCAHNLLTAREVLSNRKFYSRAESRLISNMRAIAGAVGPGGVVLASPLLSWPLPTFGPKVLVVFHFDPLVPDESEREYRVKRFLTSHATDEERRAILAQYGVTHVLLDREGGPVTRFLAKVSTVQGVGTGFRLYTLAPDAGKL